MFVAPSLYLLMLYNHVFEEQNAQLNHASTWTGHSHLSYVSYVYK